MNDSLTPLPENLADKILDRIEEEKVVPRPKWQYILRNVAMWGLWVLSVVFGAAAVAATLFVIANAGWEYAPAIHDDYPRFILTSLPYLWISTLVLTIVLGYENFRHTKWGYRYPMAVIAAVSIVASFVAGVLLFRAGIGQAVDEEIGNRVPFHRSIMSQQRVFWMSPDRGLLAGEVMSVADDASRFSLQGYDGTVWNVSADLLSPAERDILTHYKDVRVVGRFIASTDGNGNSELLFQACLVLPWEIHGRAAFIPGPERPVPFQIFVSPPDERMLDEKRSTECKGVRPYEFFRSRSTSL